MSVEKILLHLLFYLCIDLSQMDSVNGFFPPEKSQRVFSNLSSLVLLNGNLVHFAPGVTRLDRAEHSNHTKVGPKPPNRCAVHTGVRMSEIDC